MSFTYEVEENHKLSFLDVSVSRQENNFSTSLYHKPKFSGLYTNFATFIADGFYCYTACYSKCLLPLLTGRNFMNFRIAFLKVIFWKNLFP